MIESLRRIKANGKLTKAMVAKALSFGWITTDQAAELDEGLN